MIGEQQPRWRRCLSEARGTLEAAVQRKSRQCCFNFEVNDQRVHRSVEAEVCHFLHVTHLKSVESHIGRPIAPNVSKSLFEHFFPV